MALTKAQVKQYIKSKGVTCPLCGAQRGIEAGEMSGCYEPDKLVQTVECRGCGASFTEVYTLTGLELDYNPKDES